MSNTQQEGRLRSKEDLLNGIMTCTCDVAYKSRGMAAPDCAYCNYYDDILIIMEEYHNQFKLLSVDELKSKFAQHLGVPDLDTTDAYAIEWTANELK